MVDWFRNIFIDKRSIKSFFTTDHPNGAPFTSYPELFRLLMDYEFRMEQLSLINEESTKKFLFLKISKEPTLYMILLL